MSVRGYGMTQCTCGGQNTTCKSKLLSFYHVGGKDQNWPVRLDPPRHSAVPTQSFWYRPLSVRSCFILWGNLERIAKCPEQFHSKYSGVFVLISVTYKSSTTYQAINSGLWGMPPCLQRSSRRCSASSACLRRGGQMQLQWRWWKSPDVECLTLVISC